MPFFDPDSASSLPAPYWFVAFFKTLGFALHSFPMELWLVGVPLATALWLFGGVNARRQAQRFFLQTPVILAIGINLGIVPLLFAQAAYSKAFYPPTILAAAHWFSILILVLVAYYSAYLCASGANRNKRWSTTFFALTASLCLAGVGLIFSSVWTLIERPDVWVELWRDSAKTPGGAASGLATYWRDPVVYFRFASVVGLAFYALACWVVFDAFVLYRGPRPLTEEEELAELVALEEEEAAQKVANSENPDAKPARKKKPKRRRGPKPIRENAEKYRAWAVSFACCLAFVGLAVAGPALSKYFFQELRSDEPPLSLLRGTFWSVLTFGTLGSLVLPFVFLVLAKLRKMSGKTLAIWLAVCEAATLGLFATTRQFVQNVRLAPYLDVRALDDPSAVEVSPLLAFLGVFVAVALVIAWLVASAANAGKPKTPKVRKPKEPKPPKTPKKPRAEKAKPADSPAVASAAPSKNPVVSSNPNQPQPPRPKTPPPTAAPTKRDRRK